MVQAPSGPVSTGEWSLKLSFSPGGEIPNLWGMWKHQLCCSAFVSSPSFPEAGVRAGCVVRGLLAFYFDFFKKFSGCRRRQEPMRKSIGASRHPSGSPGLHTGYSSFPALGLCPWNFYCLLQTPLDRDPLALQVSSWKYKSPGWVKSAICFDA